MRQRSARPERRVCACFDYGRFPRKVLMYDKINKTNPSGSTANNSENYKTRNASSTHAMFRQTILSLFLS